MKSKLVWYKISGVSPNTVKVSNVECKKELDSLLSLNFQLFDNVYL